VSITLRRTGRTHASRGSSVVLAAALLAGLAPVAMPSAAAAAGPDTSAGGLSPTIQYQEAMAHANDRIAFAPGGRVTIPFRPRADDAWWVDGRAPRALPAGRLSGLAIRDAATPSTPVPPAAAPSDTPTPSQSPTAPDPSDSPEPDASPAPTPPESGPPDPTATPEPQPIDEPAGTGAIGAAKLASWSFAGTDPSVVPDAAVSSGGLRREIFGFLPYWELSDSTTRLDWEKLSTVAYFGVGASSTGNLIKKNSDGTTTVGWSGWTSSKLTSVINAAHTNHTRVVLTVQSFAWTSSQLANQKALLGSATARLNLAKQVAAAIRDRGADGVNLDFEPIASGYAEEFTALVRTMRAELNKVASGYQLTFDTTGYIGNYPIEDATASGGADAIFVMGYDYRSSGSSPVGSIAPVGGPLYDVADTVRAFTSRVPASKVILGVPYYGRAWSTSTDTLNASNISGAKYGASVTVLYETARDLAITNGRRYDPIEGVAWTAYRRETCTSTYGCVTSWRQVYYEDAVSLKAKYDLRGAGIWALGYDGTRTELYQAIEDKFITDTIPPKIAGSSLSSTLVSPNADGRLDTVTASLSVTGLDKWGYLVEPMSGSTAGPAIRSGTVANTKASFTWNGLRADGTRAPDGVYRITVWAADASNNRAQRQFTVTVDTTPTAMGSTVSPITISPNGDGRADSATLRWSAAQRVTGTGRILDANGAKVTFWSLVPGTSGVTTWTGRTSAGALVPDGRYTYRVTGLDPAGNATNRDLPINVDRTIASVTWSDASFDPRAGQKSQLSFRLTRTATVTVAIYVGSAVVRRVYTSASLAANTYRWTWDGKNGNGVTVKPGTYYVSVYATSSLGSTKVTRTVTVQAH
jgi:spore germination protein YaaH/flagellar hook assembly protein FlgD